MPDGPALAFLRLGQLGPCCLANRVGQGTLALRGLSGRTVEVHCACPAEVAHARYNARSRHEVHQGTLPLSAMDKYDRPVGIGPLITVDTTRPVDVAAVAAEVRHLHTSYFPGAHRGHMSVRSAEKR